MSYFITDDDDNLCTQRSCNCRTWQLVTGEPFGQCSYCGVRPRPIRRREWVDDPSIPKSQSFDDLEEVGTFQESAIVDEDFDDEETELNDDELDTYQHLLAPQDQSFAGSFRQFSHRIAGTHHPMRDRVAAPA